MKFSNYAFNMYFMSMSYIMVHYSSKSNITCHLCQKPIDTGMILNFRSCAPLQHDEKVIQWTVRRVYNAKYKMVGLRSAF